MKTIGITGQLCSGLETVVDICDAFNYPVFEADLAIKFLLNWREDIMSQIRIQFGYESTNKGFIDGNKFQSTEKFNRLLDLIEVDIMLMWEKFCLKHRKSDFVFFKSNILFEREWDNDLDSSIFIFMPKDNRIPMVMKYLNLSYNEAKIICDKEMTHKEKIKNSKYIINNFDKLSILSQFESIKAQILDANTNFYITEF